VVPAEWTLLKDASPLPHRIDYLAENPVMTPKGLVDMSQFGAVFRRATFQSGPITNINGLKLPSSSRLTVFRPSGTSGGRSASMEPFFEIEVSLTNATGQVNRQPVQPVVPGIAAVQDDRSSVSRHFFYASNAWPSVAELESSDYFKKLREINAPRKPSALALVCTKLIFAVIAGVPIIVWILRRRRTEPG